MNSLLIKRLGQVLRERRKAAGFSQEGFADHIGMHRTYYSAIERGEKNLQLDTLAKVCSGLGCKPWQVLQEADPGSSTP